MQPTNEVVGFSDSESEDDDVADDAPVDTTASTTTTTTTNTSNNSSTSGGNGNKKNNNNNNNKKRVTMKSVKNVKNDSPSSWNKVSYKISATKSMAREEEEKVTQERVKKYTARRKAHQEQMLMSGVMRSLDRLEQLPPSKHSDWLESPVLHTVSVATAVANKNIKINLRKVAMKLPNTEYVPKRMDAVNVELLNPSCKVAIFSTGSMNVSGAKSVASGLIGARKVAKMLRDYVGYDIKCLSQAKPFGGIGKGRLPFEVDIVRFAKDFPKRASYDTELQTQFCSFKDPLKFGDKGTCHIYPNGLLRIMGFEKVHLFIDWIDQMFDHCRKYRQDLLSNDAMNSQDGSKDLYDFEDDAYDALLGTNSSNNFDNFDSNYSNNSSNNSNLNNNSNVGTRGRGSRGSRGFRGSRGGSRGRGRGRVDEYSNSVDAGRMLDNKYDYEKYDKNNYNGKDYNAHKMNIQQKYNNLMQPFASAAHMGNMGNMGNMGQMGMMGGMGGMGGMQQMQPMKPMGVMPGYGGYGAQARAQTQAQAQQSGSYRYYGQQQHAPPQQRPPMAAPPVVPPSQGMRQRQANVPRSNPYASNPYKR